jgi:hypothetical protein
MAAVMKSGSFYIECDAFSEVSQEAASCRL